MNNATNNCDWFVPDGSERDHAFSRTTHLGIGAHQDDLEFMAFHGIAECFYSPTQWFGGIVCTDGSGKSHTGPYAKMTPSELSGVRRQEQRNAASLGRYSFVAQLGYPSRSIAHPLSSELVSDLTDILIQMRPRVLYTHNPADKQETHVRVLVAVLQALREIPAANRPRTLLGCEMWRGLDWLHDADKVVLDVSGQEHLAAALNGAFDSEIAGGKRYDLAIMGRRRANATLVDPNTLDAFSGAALAIDLTPLIGVETSDLLDFTMQHMERFQQDISHRIQRSLT